MKKIAVVIIYACLAIYLKAQNVGVGTTAPTARLHIEIPSGYASPILQLTSQDKTTPFVIVLNDGKVGVGLSVPLSRLHLTDTLTGSTQPDIGLRYDIHVNPSASNLNFYGKRLILSVPGNYNGSIQRIIGNINKVEIKAGNTNSIIGSYKLVDLTNGQITDVRGAHSYLAIRKNARIMSRAISNSAYLYNYSDSSIDRLFAYYGDIHHFGSGKPITIRGMGLHVSLDSPINNNGEAIGLNAIIENNNLSTDTLKFAAGTYAGVMNRGRGNIRFVRGGYFFVVNDTANLGGISNNIIEGIGVRGMVENRVNSQPIKKAISMQGEIVNRTQMLKAYGVQALIYNDSNATINEAVGVYVSLSNIQATVNKWQGVYINSTANNVQPNYWAIYSDDISPSYFKGSIGIGTNSPSEKLDIVGNVQFSGALMPGGNPGVSGQVLVSQGPGNPPQWQNLATTYSFLPQWTDYLDTLGNEVGCSGAMHMSWDKCAEVCINLTLGGFNDWRLPTIEEAVWSHKTIGLGSCNTEFFTMSFDLDGAHHHWDVFNPSTFSMRWAHIGDTKTCRCVR